MSVDNVDSPYILVIETDKYTGNFERELCAYITGGFGECGVGSNHAETYCKDGCDEELTNILSYEMDDRGCARPVSIWNYDKNIGYNDLAIFFQEQPSREQFQLIVDRCALWNTDAPNKRTGSKELIQFKGFHLLRNEVKRVITEVMV